MHRRIGATVTYIFRSAKEAVCRSDKNTAAYGRGSAVLSWLILAGCLTCLGCDRQADSLSQPFETLRSLGAGMDMDTQGVVTFINLSRSPAGDQHLACLKHFPAVQQLWLYDTRVTDEGLKQLGDLAQLQVLVLGKTDITDRGLSELAQLPTLKEIYLYPADVSEAAVRRLQIALPETLIIY